MHKVQVLLLTDKKVQNCLWFCVCARGRTHGESIVFPKLCDEQDGASRTKAAGLRSWPYQASG